MPKKRATKRIVKLMSQLITIFKIQFTYLNDQLLLEAPPYSGAPEKRMLQKFQNLITMTQSLTNMKVT